MTRTALRSTVAYSPTSGIHNVGRLLIFTYLWAHLCGSFVLTDKNLSYLYPSQRVDYPLSYNAESKIPTACRCQSRVLVTNPFKFRVPHQHRRAFLSAGITWHIYSFYCGFSSV